MSADQASPPGQSQPLSAPDEVSALIARCAEAPSIALDTEGDGMFRYRTQLCMLQLRALEEIAVVDTLAVPVAPLFGALLGAGGPEKIIHDASFDARVLFAHGVVLGRVFDTAVAARFLGFASTGLSSLLLKLFGVHLPKHQQHADWGLRPIDADAMRYLEDDVRYLPELADRLLGEVRERDIEPEVREECAYVLREAQQAEALDPPWMRIKGSAVRPARERARLYELAEERERLARAENLPPARLIPSELLLRLAQDEQVDAASVKRLLGAKAAHAGALLEALSRASQAADAPAEQVQRLLLPPPSPAERDRKKRRRTYLMEFREKQAKARGVDLQVVLPGHCLADIVELSELGDESLRAVPGFGQCRFERYGAQLRQLLRHDF